MLANHLGARGQEIPAGTFIATGGVTEAIAVNPGDNVERALPGSGHRLDALRHSLARRASRPAAPSPDSTTGQHRSGDRRHGRRRPRTSSRQGADREGNKRTTKMSSKRHQQHLHPETGEIHLGGIDAMVRLTLDQIRTDARRGLKTGMFISGYRGSPVGMLDAASSSSRSCSSRTNIKFVDGLNEDLAATAVWGTQMMHTVGKQKFDGVTGMVR